MSTLPRFEFPDDEKKYPWLRMLFDAYNFLDSAIMKGLEEHKIKTGRSLACSKGCFFCCLKHAIPANAIEMSGISWYASEKLSGDQREKVKIQLLHHKETTICPFLVNKECSVYPVRPIACRQFNVLGKVCLPGEDPFVSRHEDMWNPDITVPLRVTMILLPFFGITNREEQIKAFEQGFMVHNSKEMHLMDLKEIYNNMILFEKNL
jgi:Fe-S-cluster containining protein